MESRRGSCQPRPPDHLQPTRSTTAPCTAMSKEQQQATKAHGGAEGQLGVVLLSVGLVGAVSPSQCRCHGWHPPWLPTSSAGCPQVVLVSEGWQGPCPPHSAVSAATPGCSFDACCDGRQSHGSALRQPLAEIASTPQCCHRHSSWPQLQCLHCS